jgi:signal transduction histidine kinase
MSELEQLQGQLAAARAELQDFMSTVSHDLRAPLRHINAYAQIIAEDWPELPAEMAEHLATIRQSAQLLGSQLEGLTQLSRLSNLTLDLGPVSVGPLAQEVAQDLAPATAPDVVQWQLATDVPPVLADANLLRQLLLQLLGNALKFSRNHPPARIALSWQRLPAEETAAPGYCEIRIEDQGIGFAPQQAGQLFKVFGKLHPAREFEGLGLGLLQCRKIVERLGGKIAIAGEVNRGCCVTLRLPLASA